MCNSRKYTYLPMEGIFSKTPHPSHPCPILSTRFYRKKTEVLLHRFVLFGEQRIFLDDLTSRVFYPTIATVTPCKFVDSVESFYSANGKFCLRPDKQSFNLFDSTNGKYYARSDILCSPSENCISLVTNDPLQCCRFGRFVRFGEWIILFTTSQVEFPSDNCILLW